MNRAKFAGPFQRTPYHFLADRASPGVLALARGLVLFRPYVANAP